MDAGQDKAQDGYRLLATCICEKAISDLRSGYRSHNRALIADCESFFRSDWFAVLCDVDGEAVISAVRKSVHH